MSINPSTIGNSTHTNGASGNSSKVLWWILGGLFGPIVLTALNTVQSTSNRVSALEAEFREIKHYLQSIERKLDRAP